MKGKEVIHLDDTQYRREKEAGCSQKASENAWKSSLHWAHYANHTLPQALLKKGAPRTCASFN